MSENQFKGLADIVSEASKSSIDRYMQKKVDISKDGGIDLEAIKEGIKRAERTYCYNLSNDLFYDDSPPMTPDQRALWEAQYEIQQKEYNKLRNRIKRKYRDYRARISDAWLVLKGQAEIREDDEDY